jgi:hypothetical protein
MPHGIIGIGLLVVMSFVIFNGLLMLTAPKKHRSFLVWFRGGRSEVDGSTGSGLELGRRLAGVGLACIGIYVASSVIHDAALNQAQSQPSPGDIGARLVSLLVGLLSLSSGMLAIARPDWIVEWSKKHQPTPTEISGGTLRVWRRGAILLGVTLLLGALYVFWNLWRRVAD